MLEIDMIIVNNMKLIKFEMIVDILEIWCKINIFFLFVLEVLEFFMNINNVLMEDLFVNIDIFFGKNLYFKFMVLVFLFCYIDFVGL